MNKGDIIKYNSNFDFDNLPTGSIVKVIAQYTPGNIKDFIGDILVRSITTLVYGGFNLVFVNINTGGLWTESSLNNYSFEIIRYGPK